MSAGQPTLYRPEYCKQVIEHCRQGLSFESFAGRIGVCKDTLYEWKKVNKEFSDAVETAKEARRLFLESVGISGMLGNREYKYTDKDGNEKVKELGTFNGGVFQFIIRNAFPQEWKDKHEVESTNRNLNVNAADLSESGVERVMAILNSARERRDSADSEPSAAQS